MNANLHCAEPMKAPVAIAMQIASISLQKTVSELAGDLWPASNSNDDATC